MARFWGKMATIDWGGQTLFLLGFGLLVLGFTWGGGTYPWSSAQVLVALVVGGVLAVTWVWYEWAMVPGRIMARVFPRQKAMMPWELLMTRDVGLLLAVNFSVGTAMFAVMYFMDLYFTLVQGHSASNAGLALLYFLPGLGSKFSSLPSSLTSITNPDPVGVYTTMVFINAWPRQTVPILFLGTTCSAVGITVIAYGCNIDYLNLIYGMMALTGFGVGLNMNPGTLHALAYFPGMTAPITCLTSFAFPFGGTVTLTIMSSVFNNKSGVAHADPRTGIVWAFAAVAPIMWLAVIVTTFLGNVWIGKDGNHQVVKGAWFWSLITRKKLEKVTRSRMEDARADGGQGDIGMKTVPRSTPEYGTDIEHGRYHGGQY